MIEPVSFRVNLVTRSIFALILGMLISGMLALFVLLVSDSEMSIVAGIGLLLLFLLGGAIWIWQQEEASLSHRIASLLVPPREIIFSILLCLFLLANLLVAGYWILEAEGATFSILGGMLGFWAILWSMLLIAMYPKLVRKLGKGIMPVLTSIGMVVVIFASGEGLLRFYDSFASEGISVADVDSRPETWTTITDTELDWAEQYWLDYGYATRGVEWLPYVYWRTEPYEGVYVNIDERGIRKTLSPASSPDVTIHMYGGSTVWGVGSRDDHTIPSELVQALDEAGVAAEVVNFGELGYIARQDMTLFQLQLANGNVPDIAIFYWGFNDINANLSSGRIGITASETQRAARFEGSQCTLNLSLPLITNVLMYQTALGERLLQGMDVQPINPAEGCLLGNQDWDTMNTNLVTKASQDPYDEAEYIAQMVKQVTALADAYGVQPMFIWQPSIFHKNPLSWYEQQIVSQGRWEEFGEQYRKVDDQVRLLLGDDEQVLLWSDYFSAKFIPDLDPTLNVFIDKVHITEEGNAFVAQGIADYLTQ